MSGSTRDERSVALHEQCFSAIAGRSMARIRANVIQAMRIGGRFAPPQQWPILWHMTKLLPLFVLSFSAHVIHARDTVFAWVNGIQILGANLGSSSCEVVKADAMGIEISAGWCRRRRSATRL